MRNSINLVAIYILCYVSSCSKSEINGLQCSEPYPDWKSSEYALPFPVGKSFRVSQGNCTNQSHQGSLRYSYDLEMPFGSVVTATRDGIVYAIRMSQPQGARGLTASNWILINHKDNMKSEYIHLKQYSNLVNVGDLVKKGDTLALTGDTGDVGIYPHLHFDISPCGNNLTCGTKPVTFYNTSPNGKGLIEGKVYQAETH